MWRLRLPYPAPGRGKPRARLPKPALSTFRLGFSSMARRSRCELQLQLLGLSDLGVEPERAAIPGILPMLEGTGSERHGKQGPWRAAQLEDRIHAGHRGLNSHRDSWAVHDQANRSALGNVGVKIQPPSCNLNRWRLREAACPFQ